MTAVLVNGDDAVHRGLDDRFQLRRRFGRRLFGFFNDRDIAVDFEHHVAVRADNALHAAHHCDAAAVLFGCESAGRPTRLPSVIFLCTSLCDAGYRVLNNS